MPGKSSTRGTKGTEPAKNPKIQKKGPLPDSKKPNKGAKFRILAVGTGNDHFVIPPEKGRKTRKK